MKKNKIKRLPIHLLMSMANAACDKYGFARVLPLEMQKLYRARVAPCVMRVNTESLLWVDPEYVALQIGAGDVTYLYLSMAHIMEEYSGYKQASRERGVDVPIPEDILEQFRKAESLMKYTGRNIYIAPAAAELGLDWVDKWLKQFYSDARKISEAKEAELIHKRKEAIA